MIKKTAAKKLDTPQRGVGTGAIAANKEIAALAMAGAEPWQKIIVYLCYGIILLALVYLCIPPYATDKFKALVLVVLLLIVTVYFVIVQYRKLSTTAEIPHSLPSQTPPPPPKTIRLSSVVSKDLRAVLAGFRKEAHAFLNTKNPNLLDENVRANIFFPEYGKLQQWDDYVLKIRPGLHLNMEEPETGIILHPGQGVTDRVFQTGEPQVAKRLKPDSARRSDWDSVYQITDEVAAIIHPDLKSIISMPIKGQAGQYIGVMNLDGLIHDFKTDTLFDCAGRLTTYPCTVFGLVTGT
jgi:hypothetical protein